MERKRYSHRINITSGLWDAYKCFKEKYKLVYPNINRKKYVKLCHAINKGISEKIIKESFEFRIPYRLGTLSIRKSKLKINIKDGKLEKNKMIVDWKRTWDYWNQEYPDKTRQEINDIKGKIVIYNMNEHTDGYIMGWCWDKSTCVIRNQTVYYFKPTKGNRLALANWIKSDDKENDYYLNKRHISPSFFKAKAT
jgi:hypothetical protein